MEGLVKDFKEFLRETPQKVIVEPEAKREKIPDREIP